MDTVIAVTAITDVTADFQACIEDGTVSQIVRQRTLAATTV